MSFFHVHVMSIPCQHFTMHEILCKEDIVFDGVSTYFGCVYKIADIWLFAVRRLLCG